MVGLLLKENASVNLQQKVCAFIQYGRTNCFRFVIKVLLFVLQMWMLPALSGHNCESIVPTLFCSVSYSTEWFICTNDGKSGGKSKSSRYITEGWC